MKKPKLLIGLACIVIIFAVYGVVGITSLLLKRFEFIYNGGFWEYLIMSIITIISGILMLKKFKLGRKIYLWVYIIDFIYYLIKFVMISFKVSDGLKDSGFILNHLLNSLSRYYLIPGIILLLLYTLPSIKRYLKEAE